jgi:hypothetical protein
VRKATIVIQRDRASGSAGFSTEVPDGRKSQFGIMRVRTVKLRIFSWILVAAAVVVADDAPAQPATGNGFIRVATALEHLTVLEFGEPVTMVAAGGDSFQIERRDDKVLIKPLETGKSTDLIVWTASRRFIYELEAPGEVKDMNFVLDNRFSLSPPRAAVSSVEESADAALSAFLAARPIDSRAIRDRRRGVTVRVEHVLFAKNRIYLHYSIRNQGSHTYRLETPTVECLSALSSASLFPVRGGTQLDEQSLRRLAKSVGVGLEVASVHTPGAALPAGQKAEGVIGLDRLPASAVVKLIFAPDRGRRVEAVIVL